MIDWLKGFVVGFVVGTSVMALLNEIVVRQYRRRMMHRRYPTPEQVCKNCLCTLNAHPPDGPCCSTCMGWEPRPRLRDEHPFEPGDV